MHMHTVTHSDRCHTLERWAANYSAWGTWGACSRAPQPWQPLQLSVHQSFLSSEWGSNRQPSGYWTTTLTTNCLVVDNRLLKGNDAVPDKNNKCRCTSKRIRNTGWVCCCIVCKLMYFVRLLEITEACWYIFQVWTRWFSDKVFNSNIILIVVLDAKS